MLGSSASISEPNTVLNTIVADTLSDFADELEKAKDFDKAVLKLIKRQLQNTRELYSMAMVILMSGLRKQRREIFRILSQWLKLFLTALSQRQ